jgi:allophanate hydrolase
MALASSGILASKACEVLRPGECLLTHDPSTGVNLDLTNLTRLYQTHELSPREVITQVLRRLDRYPDPAVWIHRAAPEELLAQARAAEERYRAGGFLPLDGVPFAVKDVIDVAGTPTTAGCPAFAYRPTASAPVVERLQKAGALCVGKTNLDQFATGLAGDRTPYGVCRNVFASEYVAGGSSSGSAVAVAAGLVSFALGTDTAGSGRVPAGCGNIVGLKPAPGLLSTKGVVPACRSLDCVSVFALTVEAAWRVAMVAAGSPERLEPIPEETAPLAAEDNPLFTFATPRDEDLEFYGDRAQADLFRQAVAQLEDMGGRRSVIDFRPLREVASLLYEGPWLAERWAAVGEFLQQHPTAAHPVTQAIIEGGARYSGVDVFRGMYRLQELREICGKVFDRAEVLVVPTMPTIPTREQVASDSMGWSRRLGYCTNYVNLLGWAALALPAGFTPRGLPGGITLIGPRSSDRRLCTLGIIWQRRVNLPLGATGTKLPPTEAASPAAGPRQPVPAGYVRLAVAGAHLRGQPLHADLRYASARFVRTCRTAGGYRFVALMNLDPPRPGLLRDDNGAGAIEVEIYDLPTAGFGALVASVAPPLAIGTVELADGEMVKGFLCESWAVQGARDITEYGGWVAFQKTL